MHPHHLITTRPLHQQGLVTRRRVSHRGKHAVLVFQGQLANPPATDVGRKHQLGDQNISVSRRHVELIELRPIDLIDQFGLRWTGYRIGVVRVTDQHITRLPRDTEEVAVGFLGGPQSREHAAKN
ncbi:hypothetical protein D3C84_694740 [compost metagenome]